MKKRFPNRLLAALLLPLIITGCTGGANLSPGRDSGLAAVAPGVNPYLWRAALEVAQPLPLRQANQADGVIITGWRQLPNRPDERASMVIYLLDRQLASASLQVEVFRQQLGEEGWQDLPPGKAAATRIADAILARAQELYSTARAGG